MAWITPKTNWQATDVFDLTPDYQRIRGNILHLQDMARPLYPPVILADMANHDIKDIPGVEFFSHVDGNVDILLNNTFRPPRTELARSYAVNGRAWNSDDLNRIEGAQLSLFRILYAQDEARPNLAFVMGGGLFGAFL
jgi:hypothetical protein